MTTHPSQTVAPAVGWSQIVALTVGTTHQQKLLRAQQKESAQQSGATASLANAWCECDSSPGWP